MITVSLIKVYRIKKNYKVGEKVMAHIENITNNNFRLLAYLYDSADRNNCVRITQNEVCEAMGLTRNTIVGILNNLKDFGYITQDEKHISKYRITDIGVKIVEKVRKVDED